MANDVIKNKVNAKSGLIRVSPLKLAPIVKTIVGMEVNRALLALDFFNKKSIAKQIKSVLYSAVSNAENNFNFDIDSMVVDEAYVTKSITMKRYRAKAKGMAGRIRKRSSVLNVILKEI